MKSRLDENGNLVPVNPDGNISTTTQVRGGNSETSNATSTTDPRIATDPKNYGNQEIEIDTGQLQRDIDSGKIDNVSIRTPKQVQQDLKDALDRAQARFDANPSKKNNGKLTDAKSDLEHAIRDGECLI